MIKHLLIIFIIIYEICCIYDGFLMKSTLSPGVVSIQVNGIHHCTGSILDEKHILTAADCGVLNLGHVITVVPGASEMISSMSYAVDEIIHHQCINEILINNENRLINNIAIFRLAVKLTWTWSILPIRWDLRIIPDDSTVTLVGWRNFENILKLTYSMGVVLNDIDCRNIYFGLLTNEKCIIPCTALPFQTEREDRGMALYDSSNFAIGMFMKEGNVITNTPSSFLPIALYSEFIKNTLKNNEVDTRAKNFPYVVSIWKSNSYVCGGIIISSNRIMTAAHCTGDFPPSSFQIVVQSGASNRDETLEFRPVIQILYHKEYSGNVNVGNRHMWNFQNDIAILVIVESLPYHNLINYRLPSRQLPFGQQCEILRWKKFDLAADNILLRLKKSPAIIFNDIGCSRQGLTLTNNQFCAVSENQLPTSSVNDFGNPILCQKQVFGIVVDMDFNNAEFPARPTILIDITQYLDISQYEERY